MFYVGQKVVVIDDSPAPLGQPVPFKLREVVTVDAIGYGGDLVLREYPKGPCSGYFSHRFRPIVERKTDISIFTALLNPSNHKHLEGV